MCLFLYLCCICRNTQIAGKNCNSTKIIVVAIYQSKLNHTNSMYIVLSSISLKNKGSIRNPRYGDSSITKFSLDPTFSASVFLHGFCRLSKFSPVGGLELLNSQSSMDGNMVCWLIDSFWSIPTEMQRTVESSTALSTRIPIAQPSTLVLKVSCVRRPSLGCASTEVRTFGMSVASGSELLWCV